MIKVNVKVKYHKHLMIKGVLYMETHALLL
jgi:hypothetical protein